MKLKFKAIAAVVAFAVSGGAFAAISLPTDGTTTSSNTSGGTDLIFGLFDGTSGNSYFVDTAVAGNAFLPGSAAASTTELNVGNVTGNAAFNAYLSAEGGSLANSQWTVESYRSGQGNVTGGGTVNGIWTEITSSTSGSAAGTTTSQINGGVGPITNLITIANSDPALTPGNALFSNNPGNVDNWNNGIKSTQGGFFNFGNSNAVGTSGVAFTFMLNGGTVSSRSGNKVYNPTITPYVGTFSFNGQALNYNVSAVPEPSSYAMVVAGLALIAGVARRRVR